jgi:hypothetical protein
MRNVHKISVGEPEGYFGALGLFGPNIKLEHKETVCGVVE